MQVVEFSVFVKTYGKGFHVPAVHSSIGQVAFEGYYKTFRALIPVGVACGEEASHIHKRVFLGRHGHSIGQTEHFPHDFLDSLVGISIFADLDEICVLGKAGRVEDDALSELIGQRTYFLEILHRHGLSAGSVVRYGHYDEWHFVGVGLKHATQFGYVYIAFEGIVKSSVLSFVHSAVYSECFAAFDMPLGGVEV